MPDRRSESFTEIPYSPLRVLLSDDVRVGMTMRRIPVFAEVDVTAARSAIASRKAATGEALSFTGWFIKCLAQAVSEHPRVQAFRRGRHKILMFADVDVGTYVRRSPEGANRGPDIPIPFIIRKANEKSVETIHAEIRAAQGRGPPSADRPPTMGKPSSRQLRIYTSLPFVLRKALFWNRMLRDPFRMKQRLGTVSVTSVGMFAKIGGGSSWGILTDVHPLTVALGATSRKPALVGDRVEPREVLGVTFLFNHDVVDGAPVALFLERLKELVESAYGLAGPSSFGGPTREPREART